MAAGTKAPASPGGAKKAGADRKRLAYLKIRFREVREELQAVRKEMEELKEKVGAAAKGPGVKAKAGKDHDDED